MQNNDYLDSTSGNSDTLGSTPGDFYIEHPVVSKQFYELVQKNTMASYKERQQLDIALNQWELRGQPLSLAHAFWYLTQYLVNPTKLNTYNRISLCLYYLFGVTKNTKILSNPNRSYTHDHDYYLFCCSFLNTLARSSAIFLGGIEPYNRSPHSKVLFYPTKITNNQSNFQCLQLELKRGDPELFVKQQYLTLLSNIVMIMTWRIFGYLHYYTLSYSLEFNQNLQLFKDNHLELLVKAVKFLKKENTQVGFLIYKKFFQDVSGSQNKNYLSLQTNSQYQSAYGNQHYAIAQYTFYGSKCNTFYQSVRDLSSDSDLTVFEKIILILRQCLYLLDSDLILNKLGFKDKAQWKKVIMKRLVDKFFFITPDTVLDYNLADNEDRVIEEMTKMRVEEINLVTECFPQLKLLCSDHVEGQWCENNISLAIRLLSYLIMIKLNHCTLDGAKELAIQIKTSIKQYEAVMITNINNFLRRTSMMTECRKKILALRSSNNTYQSDGEKYAVEFAIQIKIYLSIKELAISDHGLNKNFLSIDASKGQWHKFKTTMNKLQHRCLSDSNISVPLYNAMCNELDHNIIYYDMDIEKYKMVVKYFCRKFRVPDALLPFFLMYLSKYNSNDHDLYRKVIYYGPDAQDHKMIVEYFCRKFQLPSYLSPIFLIYLSKQQLILVKQQHTLCREPEPPQPIVSPYDDQYYITIHNAIDVIVKWIQYLYYKVLCQLSNIRYYWQLPLNYNKFSDNVISLIKCYYDYTFELDDSEDLVEGELESQDDCRRFVESTIFLEDDGDGVDIDKGDVPGGSSYMFLFFKKHKQNNSMPKPSLTETQVKTKVADKLWENVGIYNKISI